MLLIVESEPRRMQAVVFVLLRPISAFWLGATSLKFMNSFLVSRLLCGLLAASTFSGSLGVCPVSAAPQFSYDAPHQGSHVAALAVDGAGSLWVGMEDFALWNRTVDDRGNQNWRQFTVQDGLGDNNAYAVAGDWQGRVWIGHRNHGVSVWNGRSWKNYGPLEGPLGERVFDIAVCPSDGDVWIATNGGLARYSDAQDKWSYFTRAEGLRDDQINAIAFDAAGNIYCGTQQSGIAIARADKNYAEWTNVLAKTYMPDRPKGAGLPSNLINDILVAHGASDGTGAGFIYAATDNGLTWSGDGGATWQFVRGADWKANVEGLAKATVPVALPLDEDELLTQDWSTCLAEDRAGLIWVGHRRAGFESRDPHSMRATYASSNTTLKEGDQDYVRALLDVPGIGMLGARYGNPSNPGVFQILAEQNAPVNSLANATRAQTRVAPFPSPAAPLDAAQLDALRARLTKLETPLQAGEATFLGDDWATQGDWVGRYGRGHATLAAMEGGSREQFQRLTQTENHVFEGAPGYSVKAQVGPHHKTGLVSWVTFANTQIPASLFDPLLGHRRQAEWIDMSNSFVGLYPWAYDGPDIWLSVQVPAGLHRASLYFHNKDGQSNTDRFRDFTVEVKGVAPEKAPAASDPKTRLEAWQELRRQLRVASAKFASDSPEVTALQKQVAAARALLMQDTAQNNDDAELRRVDALPTQARARVTDFWGGVYKQFALRGPATFYFKVRRNHSNGTTLAGVMLDALPDPKNGAIAPTTAPTLLPWMNGAAYDAPPIEEAGNARDPQLLAAARNLWAGLDEAVWEKGGQRFQTPLRLQALRAAVAAGASPSLVANWRWNLQLWDESDRTIWNETMKRAFPPDFGVEKR